MNSSYKIILLLLLGLCFVLVINLLSTKDNNSVYNGFNSTQVDNSTDTNSIIELYNFSLSVGNASTGDKNFRISIGGMQIDIFKELYYGDYTLTLTITLSHANVTDIISKTWTTSTMIKGVYSSFNDLYSIYLELPDDFEYPPLLDTGIYDRYYYSAQLEIKDNKTDKKVITNSVDELYAYYSLSDGYLITGLILNTIKK